MKNLKLRLVQLFSLVLVLFASNLYSQGKIANDRSGLVEITAKTGDDVSLLIQSYDEKVAKYQDKMLDDGEDEYSVKELARIFSGIDAFDDSKNIDKSLLVEKENAYLNMLNQVAKAENKEEFEPTLTEREKYVLSMSHGLAYTLRKLDSGNYGFILNVDGKRGLIAEDKEGNSGSVELGDGDDPNDKGGEIEMRGKGSCYKYGFDSKLKRNGSKYAFSSMGFAGYSYTCCWVTVQGYASYAKVLTFKKGSHWWSWSVYRTNLSASLNGNIYNHKCKRQRHISNSNSKSNSWFCATKKWGLGRSRIKNSSLNGNTSAGGIGNAYMNVR